MGLCLQLHFDSIMAQISCSLPFPSLLIGLCLPMILFRSFADMRFKSFYL